MQQCGLCLEITVQLVEIYNDQLRDLLAEGSEKLRLAASHGAVVGAVSQRISTESPEGLEIGL